MSTKQAYPQECDPARVRFEIARLRAEWRTRPTLAASGGADFRGEARAAQWTADWFGRLLEQHRRLGVWAQFTRQPLTVRQAIGQAERDALRKALGARARANEWQQRAEAAVMPDPATAVA